jgi:hypothetical protein
MYYDTNLAGTPAYPLLLVLAVRSDRRRSVCTTTTTFRSPVLAKGDTQFIAHRVSHSCPVCHRRHGSFRLPIFRRHVSERLLSFYDETFRMTSRYPILPAPSRFLFEHRLCFLSLWCYESLRYSPGRWQKQCQSLSQRPRSCDRYLRTHSLEVECPAWSEHGNACVQRRYVA